jgi:hypothetical protein
MDDSALTPVFRRQRSCVTIPANLVIRSRLVCIHRNTAPLKICIPGFEAALLPDK